MNNKTVKKGLFPYVFLFCFIVIFHFAFVLSKIRFSKVHYKILAKLKHMHRKTYEQTKIQTVTLIIRLHKVAYSYYISHISMSATHYITYTLFIIHLCLQGLDVFAVYIVVIIHKLIDCTIRCKLDYAVSNSLDKLVVVA